MSPSTSRAAQARLIARLRTGLITSSVVSALGIAGYLGATSGTTAAAEPTDTGSTDSSTTDTGTSTDSGTSSYYGDSAEVASGSGSSHAQTSGS